ncbi:MAG: S8 family serine peptidase [Pirellulaceae bacterium]
MLGSRKQRFICQSNHHGQPSLGSEWNSDTIPDWATLEDEFAQLESDGIFISVAAGNSFANYLSKGLSYPAVSSHVTAVASHGADGQLSDFSQRDDKVLVAPGENIRSTVPDHLFGGTATGQFLGASGTSMAAPYVAGASVLLREAFEFMGDTDIDQAQLYNHLVANADRVFDSVTGGWYNHLNLEKALNAAMADDYGNSWVQAQNLGNLVESREISGIITRTNDVDVFSFNAAQSGRVTMTFETTHDLQALVKVVGADAQWSGNELSFDVVAGQQYKFSVATTDGTGHYQIQASLESNQTANNLGGISFQEKHGEVVEGEALYRMAVQRDGTLTVVGQTQSGNLQYQLLNAQQQVIRNGTLAQGAVRLDVDVNAGDTVFLKVIGEGTTDLTMANLVSAKSGTLTIHGTDGADTVSVDQTNGVHVSVNGIEYAYNANQARSVQVYGHGGADRLDLQLSGANDNTSLGAGWLKSTGGGVVVNANGFETQTVLGGGGNDQLKLFGTSGRDTGVQTGGMTRLSGTNYNHFAAGYEVRQIFAGTGNDTLSITGTAGSDRFAGTASFSTVTNHFGSIKSVGFETTSFDGSGGNDIVNLYDSAGNDTFVLGNGFADVSLANAEYHVQNVDRISVLERWN